MKLNNICEANNVLNKEEIQGFLDACNYDKKWTVNKSGEISLGGNFKLDSNLLSNNNIKTLPLKIKKAKNFLIYYTKLQDYDFIPKESNEIRLHAIELDYKNLNLNFYNTDFLGLSVIYNIDNMSIAFETCDDLMIRDCKDLRKLQIKSTRECSNLLISSCKVFNLKDGFNNVSNVVRISIMNCQSVTGFCVNTIYVNDLSLSMLDNLQSWRNINDNTIIKELRIDDISQLNNFICVMLLETDKITNNNKNINFTKYEKIKNRSEHIMDCAVDFIEAGFPEAAEL